MTQEFRRAARLPSRIPLPAVPSTGHVDDPVPASLVRGPEDLPSRFILGALVEDSFVATADGWTARYASPVKGGSVLLTCSRVGGVTRTTAQFSWRNHEALSSWQGERLMDVLKGLGPATHIWDDAARELVETFPPLSWHSAGRNQARFVFFPDGILIVLALPVRQQSLPTLLSLHSHLAEAGTCAAGLRAGCVLARPTTGSYVYIATLFLQDLEALLLALASSGLLGERVASGVVARRLSGEVLLGSLRMSHDDGSSSFQEVNILDAPIVERVTAGASWEEAATLVTAAAGPSRGWDVQHEPRDN